MPGDHVEASECSGQMLGVIEMAGRGRTPAIS